MAKGFLDEVLRLTHGTEFNPVIRRTRVGGGSVRVRNGRAPRAVGRFASVKNGTSHFFESEVEYQDLLHAEVDPTVVSYVTQPETLCWVSNGRTRSYTPDRVDVLASNARVFVEIKDTYHQDDDPAYAEKLAEAAEIFRLRGAIFVVRTRAEIIAEPLFSAVAEVQRHCRAQVTLDHALRAGHLLEKGAISLGGFVRQMPDPHPRSAVMALMVRRLIRIDLSKGLTDASQVSLLERSPECEG